MKKLLLILLCFPMIGFSCFSQTQSDSLAGFDEKHELDHIMVHGIDSSQIDFYLDLAKRRYINRKYNLGFYAPPEKLSSSSAFDCAVDNWGFEDGTFGGWNQQGAVGIVNNGVDPYGGFSWVYPNGGNFSAKISSDLNGSEDGRLDKVLNVPVNGETLMSFHFAMSIFNYPHISSQAAKLWVEFYDGGGNLLLCPQYECYYSTDNGAVGVNNFQETPQVASFYNPAANGDGPGLYPVTYADWNTVTLDLSNYQGQQITAVFRVEWCLPGPDWAYVLLDVDCPINTFEPRDPCASFIGPETLCGPDNMSSYLWYDPSGTVVGNNQCLDINAPGAYVLEAMPDDVECTSASLLTFNYSIDPPLNISYLVSNYNGINISCNGNSDGAIDLSVNGGSGSYSYLWSNGSTTEDLNSLSAGTYSVTVTDANSCTIFADFILTEPVLGNGIKAEFNVIPELSIHHLYEQMDNPIFFIDKSVDVYTSITKWFWEFEDGFTSNEQDTKHTFENIGDFNITLAIEHLNGCMDTTAKRLIINEFLLYIPNSFTPQGDKINDSFLPKGIGIKEYELKIYNRWGKHFFTSNNLNIGWNGTANKKDKIAQIGVYVYLINVTDVFGEKHTYRGQVTLIK
jgi:gliding motility-associated-like protein